MATDLSGSNYSETDASNNNAAPNGMPEGMAPSGVNDAWRQGMGAVKRAWDRDHATATVGGTANAITLTYTVGPASYVQGEKFAFKATAANTGATTVNVSGLGAKNVFRFSGSSAVALTGGEIQNGQIVEIEYDGTQFQLLSLLPGMYLLNTQTAVGASQVDFTQGMDGSFSELLFVLAGITTSASTDLNVRISQDAGSTFKAGASAYRWMRYESTDGAAITFGNSAGDTMMRLFSAASTTNPAAGELRAFRIGASAACAFRASTAIIQGSGAIQQMESSGYYQADATAITGIRFIPSSGTVSGTISLYGLRK